MTVLRGLCLVGLIVLVVAYDVEKRKEEFPEFEVETTTEAEECEKKAAWGDTVMISHKGFYGQQAIDATKEGEPLKVTIGSLLILEGMELGMVGQCVGETRKMTIPGPLAFDREIYRSDPKRQPPVPVGESVTYEVTLEEILPAWHAYRDMMLSGRFWSVAGVLILLSTMGYLSYAVLNTTNKPKKDRKDKGKKKK